MDPSCRDVLRLPAVSLLLLLMGVGRSVPRSPWLGMCVRIEVLSLPVGVGLSFSLLGFRFQELQSRAHGGEQKQLRLVVEEGVAELVVTGGTLLGQKVEELLGGSVSRGPALDFIAVSLVENEFRAKEGHVSSRVYIVHQFFSQVHQDFLFDLVQIFFLQLNRHDRPMQQTV